jgi:hypothetical protein
MYAPDTRYNQFSGTFTGVRIYYCHTSRSSLSSTFTDNYDGHTPMTVYSNASLSLNWPENTWGQIPFDEMFSYNGTDNLLIEIQWDGSPSGGLITSTTSGTGILGSSVGAASGSSTPRACMRMHYDTPAAPVVVHQDTQVSSGDGLIDAGETIQIAIELANFGATASGMQATLSTTSTHCTVTQAAWSPGDVANGVAVDNTASPYVVDIGLSVPSSVPLQLHVSANSGSYTETFFIDLAVASPDLTIDSFFVNDLSGNADLALNPDERAHIVVVLNNAGSQASNVVGTLSCNSPKIALVSDTSEFGVLEKLSKSGNGSAPFCVQVASDAWDNGLYQFSLDLSYGSGLSESLTFEVGTDYATESGASSWVDTTGGTTHTAINGPGTYSFASSLSVFKKLRQQLIPKLRLIPSVCLENTGC